MNVPSRSVVLTIVVLIGLLASVGFAQADDSGWKAANDTDPHLPLTQQQLAATASKRSAENQFAAIAPNAMMSSPFATCGPCGGGFPSSASIVANQSPQQTSYWCGPAAVQEALGALGVSISQGAAATALHTDGSGTAWSGGGTSPSGYPVPDVLNRYQSRNYYVPQSVSTPPGSGALNTYETDLESNISKVGAPVVGNAWETPSGYHLNGHPRDHVIQHWFEIRGYYGSGATTLYEDSVHGATSISWSGSVPAYSNQASSEIVSILGGRGYVW